MVRNIGVSNSIQLGNFNCKEMKILPYRTLLIIYFVLNREELLKFMGKKHLARQHLHFTSLRKLKSLEVCTNFGVSSDENLS